MKSNHESKFNFRKFIRSLDLPEGPGVYQMIDENEQILYIGKANNLRKRVLSYSRVTGIRISQMIYITRSIKIIQTKTEAEALMLEALLVKKVQPFYNVLLKDDKSFPYIVITNHEFPRIKTERLLELGKEKKDKHLMQFGPFLKITTLQQMIQALQKAFLIRSCTDSEFKRRKRPCILYEINKCAAPCVGKIDAKSYEKLVGQVRKVFQWEGKKIILSLKKNMLESSEAGSYELADLYKKRLEAARQVLVEQKNLGKVLKDRRR